jgi:HEAT repeat protein
MVALAGCHSFLGYRGWPYPEPERTTFHTPAMRIDTIRQFAGRADGTDSESQRELTDQLARQIQIEPDPLVRRAIVEAVAEFRTPLAQQIVEAGLNDENQAVRVASCQVLGTRAETLSVPSLARALRDEKQIDVRLAAAEALGRINSPESMAALVVALDARDPALQYVGVQSMKSISGLDYGGDVAKWRQVATGGTPPEAPPPPSIAERLWQGVKR